MTFLEGFWLFILSPVLVLFGIIGLLLVLAVAAAIIEVFVFAGKGIALVIHDWKSEKEKRCKSLKRME